MSIGLLKSPRKYFFKYQNDKINTPPYLAVPPVIQRANVRRQVVGVAGQSTDLLCEASGNPPPTLAWTRGNTLITPEHPHYQVDWPFPGA